MLVVGGDIRKYCCLWVWSLFVGLEFVCGFGVCLWVWSLFVGLEFVCGFNDTYQWHPLCYPLSPSLQPTREQEHKVI